MRSLGMIEILVFVCVALVFALLPIVGFCQISKRLGWSPWWGLIAIVPFGIAVWSLYVGFSEWPNRRTGEMGSGA
jgi:hypothetical protein